MISSTNMQLTKRHSTNNKKDSLTSKEKSNHGRARGNGWGRVTVPLLVVLCITLLVIDGQSPSSLFYKNLQQQLYDAAPSRTGGTINTGSTTTATMAGTGGGDTSLAYHHSFGLFDDIPKKEWESLRAKTKASSWYGNPQNPLEGVDDAQGWRDNNMIPTFDCPRMEGVGVGGQQTKLVCNPKRLVKKEENSNGPPRCLIYSIGSAGDFHFEDSIANMHHNTCEIHVFDPADWSRPDDPLRKNIHYHAWGISSTYDDSKSVVWPKGRKGGFKTLPETLQLLGHQGRTIDMFKIDCEGCEWSSISDWISFEPRQILIEMHGVPSPRGTPKARWYQKPMNLTHYYGHFQTHGYALYSKDLVGNLAVELSFIKLHEDFWKD
mmetsp:Transcript_19245/g.22240  ORF Transcript_19245/g.22240 Transcript_19245/m.22240 type:complete len:378 (+) Transcript_19245:42-1175(+)